MSQRPEQAGPGRPARWRARRLTLTGLPALLAAGGVAPVIVHVAAPAALPRGVLCVGFAGCDSRGYDSYGYGAHWGRMYWRMYPGNNCTNYVAYVESTVYHVRRPRFLLGDGGSWAATASAHGVPVNHRPSVGAVAQWGYGVVGSGHVAVVEKVGPRGSYILVSQDGMSTASDGYDWVKIVRGRAGQFEPWPSAFIHFAIPPRAALGYYSARARRAYFRYSQTYGPVTGSARLGSPGTVPLAGDWRGNGLDGVGYYDRRLGTFRLLRVRRGRHPDVTFRFGPAWMLPLVGDWTGIGRDGIGYYDPRTGRFAVRESLTTGRPDRSFVFGPPGMVPLAGDWSGDGRSGVGYYDPESGRVSLRLALSAGRPWRTFWIPRHMIPIVGNWLGGRRDYVGYYNKWTGTFYLRRGLTSRPAGLAVRFGPRVMFPLVGDWLS